MTWSGSTPCPPNSEFLTETGTFCYVYFIDLRREPDTLGRILVGWMGREAYEPRPHAPMPTHEHSRHHGIATAPTVPVLP